VEHEAGCRPSQRMTLGCCGQRSCPGSRDRLPAGTSASMALRNRMNSWCRWVAAEASRRAEARRFAGQTAAASGGGRRAVRRNWRRPRRGSRRRKAGGGSAASGGRGGAQGHVANERLDRFSRSGSPTRTEGCHPRRGGRPSRQPGSRCPAAVVAPHFAGEPTGHHERAGPGGPNDAAAGGT
jgi:hypothetical protein